jgi:uncharacterized protein YkwD
MRTSRLLRPLVVVLVSLAVLLTACTTEEEKTLAQLTNHERARAGIRTLVVDDRASGIARDWSAVMARENRLRHNPNLAREINRRVGTGWRSYGENVGRGSDIRAMHRGFMSSPGHRANVLNRTHNRVGVGVVAKNGRFWATVVFIGY